MNYDNTYGWYGSTPYINITKTNSTNNYYGSSLCLEEVPFSTIYDEMIEDGYIPGCNGEQIFASVNPSYAGTFDAPSVSGVFYVLVSVYRASSSSSNTVYFVLSVSGNKSTSNYTSQTVEERKSNPPQIKITYRSV